MFERSQFNEKYCTASLTIAVLHDNDIVSCEWWLIAGLR